jgi:hypothetical protein
MLKALNEDPKLLSALFSQVTPKLMQAPTAADTSSDEGEGASSEDIDELLSAVPTSVKSAVAAVEDEG